ncbi:MAG: hypothetical protein WBA27_09150 [Pseudomonas neustonica]
MSPSQPVSEILLQRILAYWAWSGVTIDEAAQVSALAITTRLMREPDDHRLALSLQMLQAELPVHQPLPAASPPLQRGSMRYGDY